MSERTYRLLLLTLLLAFGLSLLWMIYDLKQQIAISLERAKSAVVTGNATLVDVKAQLPQIASEVRVATSTLKRLAEDVELLKSVAGVQNEGNSRALRDLTLYANSLQEMLAEKARAGQAQILIEEVFGSDLKVHESLDEFLVGLNKEMLLAILPLSKSKQEILYRVCHAGLPRRKPFYIQWEGAEPALLSEYIKQEHPASRDLPDYPE